MMTRRTLFAFAPLVALQANSTASFVQVSPRDRRYLELSDGSPYILIGLNLIAPPEVAKDGTPGLRVYESWLDKLCSNGGNYVRAWLSNSFWDVEHAKSGEYDLWWHFGRFAEVVKDIDPAAEDFAPSLIPHDRLRVYRLAGRRTTLLWCRDIHNDWRSELERGESPAVLGDTSIELKLERSQPNVRAYDPWAGKWAMVTHRNGRIALPDFRRSVIVRIS